MATKGDDCYFYYNAECLKGDQCPFRHSQAALGNDTVCKLWLQGSCFRSACPFRHMHITPSKSELSCYFETQPSGCLKPNCPFKHFKPRNVSTLGTSSMPVMSTTQPVVAVRPSVRGSTNLVQAQDTETPNFLGAVKEGMTSLSAQPDNKGTSNLTVSGQIVTPTKPIDSFSFELSKLTLSNPMPFAVQQPITTSTAVSVKSVNEVKEGLGGVTADGDQQQRGVEKVKDEKSAVVEDKAAALAAKKKARAERFGLKTLPHPQRNISPTTSIPTIPVKPLTSSTTAALTSTHQHVTNTTKAVQTTKQSKRTAGSTKSENKDATSTAESEKSKPGIQQIVWDLDGKKKDTLPIKSPTINKPKTDVQKPESHNNSIDISSSDRDTNRSENPSSSSVNDKRKLQEIKWDLGDVKRVGVLSVGTLPVRMKRRASEGGATNESNRQNVDSSGGGNDEGQKGQTVGASGASVMKIRLTAKASSTVRNIVVKSFEEIMREKRQKKLAADSSTTDHTSAPFKSGMKKRRKSRQQEATSSDTKKPKMSENNESVFSSIPDASTSERIESIATDDMQVTSSVEITEDEVMESKREDSSIDVVIDTKQEKPIEEREGPLLDEDRGETEALVEHPEVTVEKEKISTTAGQRVLLRRISHKAKDDSLLDAELEEMLGELSSSDIEDSTDGPKDDDDLILDIEELVNS